MRRADPILSQLLSEAHQALDAMEAPGGPDAAGPFLSRLFHVGARLHRDPGLLQVESVQGLLARAAAPNFWAGLHIQAYARALDEMNFGSWEVGTDAGVFSIDHWARSCTERSALEFALELLPGLFFESAKAEASETLYEADAHFKAKIDRFDALPHPEQTPAGVPLSHWWWRYEGGEED